MHPMTPHRPDSALAALNPTSNSLVMKISIPLLVGWMLLIGVGFVLIPSSWMNGPLACLVIGGVMVAFLGGSVALVAIVGLGYRKLITARVEPARVFMDVAEVERGRPFRVMYQQRFKQQTALEGVSIKLVLREWVKYDCGSSTCTDKHDEVLHESQLPGSTIKSGQVLKHRAEFLLPPDAMHNFSSSHNRLQWLVIVQSQMRMWPDFHEEYVINLTPETTA